MNSNRIVLILLFHSMIIIGMEQDYRPIELSEHLSCHLKDMHNAHGRKPKKMVDLPLGCQDGKCLAKALEDNYQEVARLEATIEKKTDKATLQSIQELMTIQFRIKELIVDRYQRRASHLIKEKILSSPTKETSLDQEKSEAWRPAVEKLLDEADQYQKVNPLSEKINKRNRALLCLSRKTKTQFLKGVDALDQYVSDGGIKDTDHDPAMQICMNQLKRWLLLDHKNTPATELGTVNYVLGKVYESCDKKQLACEAYEAAARYENVHALFEVGLRIFAAEDCLTAGLDETHEYLKKVCDCKIDDPHIKQKQAVAHCLIAIIEVIMCGDGHAEFVKADFIAPDRDKLFQDCAQYISSPFLQKIDVYLKQFLNNSGKNTERKKVEVAYYLARCLLNTVQGKELGKQTMQAIAHLGLGSAIQYIALDEDCNFAVHQKIQCCFTTIKEPENKNSKAAIKQQCKKFIMDQAGKNNLIAVVYQLALASFEFGNNNLAAIFEKCFNWYEILVRNVQTHDSELDARALFIMSTNIRDTIKQMTNNVGARLFLGRCFRAALADNSLDKEVKEQLEFFAHKYLSEAKQLCVAQGIDINTFAILRNVDEKNIVKKGTFSEMKAREAIIFREKKEKVPVRQQQSKFNEVDIKAKLVILICFLTGQVNLDYEGAVSHALEVNQWKAQFNNNVPQIELVKEYNAQLADEKNLRAQYLLHFLSDKQQDVKSLAMQLWRKTLNDFDRNGTFCYADLKAACTLERDIQTFYNILDESLKRKFRLYVKQYMGETAERSPQDTMTLFWICETLACSSDKINQKVAHSGIRFICKLSKQARRYIAFFGEPNEIITDQEICANCLDIIKESNDINERISASAIFDSYVEQGYLYAQFRLLLDAFKKDDCIPNLKEHLKRLDVVPSKKAYMRHHEDRGPLFSLFYHETIWNILAGAAAQGCYGAQNFLMRTQLTDWNVQEDFAKNYLPALLDSGQLTAEHVEYKAFLCWNYALYLKKQSFKNKSQELTEQYWRWLIQAKNFGHQLAQCEYATELLYEKISRETVRNYDDQKNVVDAKQYGVKLLEEVLKMNAVIQGGKSVANMAFNILDMFYRTNKNTQKINRLQELARELEIIEQDLKKENIWQLSQGMEKITLEPADKKDQK